MYLILASAMLIQTMQKEHKIEEKFRRVVFSVTGVKRMYTKYTKTEFLMRAETGNKALYLFVVL